ncbi:VTT domain-containing protein [Candidatus Saccharibacteria bacterium]|nr:VTT domain-containing protein [Candidatus Saccharibacteria bacterium]
MFNIDAIIQSGGLLAIALIIFAETGLLAGFFLPGDTLLFTAGLFAATGKLNIIALLITVILSAIIGDNVGYQIGKKTGHLIFKKKEGIFFRAEYIEKAQKFYEAHGGKTIVLARFVPIVRTFAPVVAGVGNMKRERFFFYNIFGGIIWGAGITLLGYYLGTKIPNIEKLVIPVFILANILTWSPVAWHVLKDRESRARLKKKLRRNGAKS